MPGTQTPTRSSRHGAVGWAPWVLTSVLVLAAALRVGGIDWDAGTHLHPDERFLTMVVERLRFPDAPLAYLDGGTSPLNPRNVGFDFFVYGTLPTTTVRGLGQVVGRTSFAELPYVGRVLSAAIDVATVLLLFYFAVRLYADERIAALAAGLYATAVLAVQHAHFFVVDPWVTCFSLATLFGLDRVLKRGSLADYAAAGALWGLALACKVSSLLLGVLFVPVVVFDWIRRAREGSRTDALRALIRVAAHGALAVVVALLVFRVGQPDAFSGPRLLDLAFDSRWLDDLREARRLSDPEAGFPPGLQWIDRTPFWFVLENSVWGLGPALALAAWGGWSWALVRTLKRGDLRHLLPVTWVGITLVVHGTAFVKAQRYLLPVYPALALLAAWALVELCTRPNRGSEGVRRTARAWTPVAVVVLLSLAWVAAFTAIYRRPHSRIEASRWIYANVPPTSTLAVEHWDDALPLAIDTGRPEVFERIELRWYDPDTRRKLQQILDRLERADYLVLSSNRLYDSIPRSPDRYPMTTRYYRTLFDGSLGWRRVADFTSYPSLFGISFPDQRFEEALTVYDHPRVQIFEKTGGYDGDRAKRLLGEGIEWPVVPSR